MDGKSTNTLLENEGYLLNVVAHKLRGPTNAINALLHLIKQELHSTNVDKNNMNMLVDNIEMAVGNSMGIIDLLDKFNFYEMRMRTFDLNVILKHLEQLAVADNIIFTNHSKESHIQILADENKIYECFIELYNNSKKWFDKQNKTIDVLINEDLVKSQIEIIYTDNGIGIRPDNKVEIFEPGTCFGRNKGKGLGLSLVKKVIELHEGVISENGIEGIGARFTISLHKKK